MIYEDLFDCNIICPITCEIANYPVKTNCGHIFEKEELLKWLEISSTCPLCRKKLLNGKKKDTTVNLNLNYNVNLDQFRVVNRQLFNLINFGTTEYVQYSS